MCKTHRGDFDSLGFFIRSLPDVRLIPLSFRPNIDCNQIRKFMFINYSDDESLQESHGNAIDLDIKDKYAPLPPYS